MDTKNFTFISIPTPKKSVGSPTTCGRGRRRNSAFTIIELLVVIAIIGVLMALLIPAVQSAREAARRAQCLNHIKQWTLAAQSFHSTHDRFPCNGNDPFWVSYKRAGTQERIDAVNVYGWRTLLLPFVEQSALSDELTAGCRLAASLNPYPAGDDAYLYIARPWTWDYHRTDPTVHGKGSSPFGEFFAILGCPSDGNVRGSFGSNTRGSNYMGCTGDYMISELWVENSNNRGMFRHYFGDSSSLTNPWGFITATTVKDGQSNTMYISETATASYTPGVGVNDWRIKSGVANKVSIHRKAASECMKVIGQGGEFNRAVVSEPWLEEGKGQRWGHARNPYAMYNAALPPNAPSCRDLSSCTTISASSYHVGGVNVSMVDGSVRFINDSIYCGDLTKRLGEELQDPVPDPWGGHWWTGPSTVGVWGALATPAGGETVSL